MTDRQKAIKKAIAETLETFDYETLSTGYIFIGDISVATDLGDITHSEFAEAAEALKSNTYDMYARHADEFSPQSYLWVTPSPNCKEPATPGEPVDSAYIVLIRDRTEVMIWDEKLLIFSRYGYAAGYIIATGTGDFDVIKHTWAELLESPFQEVILDYVEDANPNVIKLVRS